MAGAQFIDISNSSRYKDTRIFDSDFGPIFGLMELPAEFVEPREDERVHTIKKNDVGFLDHLAVRYYGQGYEKYGWVIGLVNRLIDPDRDMAVGQRLRIPSRVTIQEFASRVSRV